VYAYRNWETVKGWVPLPSGLPSFGGGSQSKSAAATDFYTIAPVSNDAAASFYTPPSAGGSLNDAGGAYAAM